MTSGGRVTVLCATGYIRGKATWLVSLDRVQRLNRHVGSGCPFVACAHNQIWARMGPDGWLRRSCRENVLEAGGCRCDLDVQADRVLSMLGEGYQGRCLQVLGKSASSTVCFRCLSQAALDILWGAKALVVEEDGELRQRRGKLDVADAAYLRCLMRRYGWERSAGGVDVCSWSECFPSAHYQKKKYVRFAWTLVTQLLHPRNTPSLQALRARHSPALVRELCASRARNVSPRRRRNRPCIFSALHSAETISVCEILYLVSGDRLLDGRGCPSEANKSTVTRRKRAE